MLYDKKWDKEVPVKLEPWQEHLLAAAQYIRDHGWYQGWFQDLNGRVCAAGAIANVVGSATEEVFALRKLEVFIGGSTARWNDNPERTKEQVIAALEGAAKQGE